MYDSFCALAAFLIFRDSIFGSLSLAIQSPSSMLQLSCPILSACLKARVLEYCKYSVLQYCIVG